ncbi:MAG: Bax inhibitor-1 family protein [Chloroflexi bacterium]|nr:Bax inhibitor-1 family protein [Chloroflexota bacterium]
MRTYRKSKRYDGLARNAPPLEPLDNTQLNAVMRSVFAWMTVGLGITATVASALLVSPITPDLAGLVIIIIAHLTIAFTLDRKLRRFSPTQAGAFFLFYAALTGFTISTLFAMLFYPTVSGALVTASTSTGCLFGLMTLIGWGTRLDFSRSRSYVLMALLGILIAYLANKLLIGGWFETSFSFFSVFLFSALVACHRAPFAALAADPDLKTKPADSLRFSILAALQLYVTAGNMIAVALSSNLPGSRGLHYDGRMPHYHQSHYSGISGGTIISGGDGGNIGGGGGVGGGAGGGESFTP